MVSGALELTTVADDEVVFHVPAGADGSPARAIRYGGLDPDTTYTLEGVVVRTLPRPPGERLATFATVNDVHFGETECGVIEGSEIGPILHSLPGEDPYPEIMNRGAVAEISAAGVDAVVVKGDLTSRGTDEEFAAFEACYGSAFGDRLHWVRGNHDVAAGDHFTGAAPFSVSLPGVTLAVFDSAIPGQAGGRVTPATLQWLGEVSAAAGGTVLVFAHHHAWSPESSTRSSTYFGINPDDSEALVELAGRSPNICGYFAGHTHRNRVRHFAATGAMPWVEVACVKDFPGAWAEYRVYEGGILQIHRRISPPEALDWSERTRGLYGGFYQEYAFGRLEDRCFVVPTPADR